MRRPRLLLFHHVLQDQHFLVSSQPIALHPAVLRLARRSTRWLRRRLALSLVLQVAPILLRIIAEHLPNSAEKRLLVVGLKVHG